MDMDDFASTDNVRCIRRSGIRMQLPKEEKSNSRGGWQSSMSAGREHLSP